MLSETVVPGAPAPEERASDSGWPKVAVGSRSRSIGKDSMPILSAGTQTAGLTLAANIFENHGHAREVWGDVRPRARSESGGPPVPRLPRPAGWGRRPRNNRTLLSPSLRSWFKFTAVVCSRELAGLGCSSPCCHCQTKSTPIAWFGIARTRVTERHVN